MQKKKVLILHAPLGAGHETAAKAIAEAFLLRYPNIEIKSADVLDFSYEIFKQTLPKAFYFLTFYIPFLYKLFYDYSNHRSRYKFLNHVSSAFLKKSRFVKFINDFNPDFIISTNPLPMQLVSKTKEKNIIDILSANVCTDFGFHTFWHNADVNYYFAANEKIKRALISYGAIPESVKVTGIPISSKFSKLSDRQKTLGELGFDVSMPVLLIVGGTTAYGKLMNIIGELKKRNNLIQFIVVAGRDENLQKKLKKSKINSDPLIRTFGFVNNLDEYMTATDLIFTKAGGLTIAECLTKGLPMVIYDIIPGQEEDNLNYVVSHGAGIKAENIKKSVEAVVDFFSQPEKLAKMKENCRKIAKPNAANDLADFVASILNSK
ncbi:MAG: UDP-N-acetylglucosamine:LPS N-acetylglucosamine transferase [Parcubacteria group bacterium Licking1014_1]|nr:MAG: UDP-N-acetylglucosamine:LPS N-acetylglucosamine transferase [Parcubacteria group bacterium Licking1014_1]